MNDDLAERIRWAAFDRLRVERPTTAAELSADLKTGIADVERCLAEEAAAGRIEVDTFGSVVGAYGLSLWPTKHALEMNGAELHTWCALDAIGIPAASDDDADIITSCGWCGRALTVVFRGGVPDGCEGAVLWLPSTPCENVRQQFCPATNLFCSHDHLEHWRRDAGHPKGQELSVQAAAELGRELWRRDRRSSCSESFG